ncbi:type III secretion system protein SctP [Mycetohabitans sp. B8]|uniref:type III secretion system protein SctP n=1 Tax=Mycetohabitans sp. B8 TaxID=2841845 RepID=UPI001F46CF98|nr:type III secretion system protein SctP [Mycetohabitans sp. B8]MCG1042853.1 type III secretion system protein SctP [Mycetohabitans sp. B8]
MTSIRNRPVRIIPRHHDRHDNSPVHNRRLRLDYASLARRAKPLPNTKPPVDKYNPNRIASGFVLAIDPDADSDDESPSDENADRASRAVRRRLRSAVQPVVEKILLEQGSMLDMARRLAQEIAAFCTDSAINDTGTWEASLPLDPALLPDTTLNLTLSYSTLSLRFDTTDNKARELILSYASMLEHELDTLLRAWGAPRDIELTVW